MTSASPALQTSHRTGMRWLCSSLAIGLTLALGTLAPISGQEIPAPDRAPIEDLPTDVLEAVDENVKVGENLISPEGQLAEIEAEIASGCRLLFAGAKAEADARFLSAYTSILTLHDDMVKRNQDANLARTTNLAFGASADQQTVETWRPLPDVLNRWLAMLPQDLRTDMDQRLEGSAAADMSVLRKNFSLAGLERIAQRYLFTRTGGRAAAEVARRLHEQGEFLSVVRWLDMLREHRADLYSASPGLDALLHDSLRRLGAPDHAQDLAVQADVRRDPAVLVGEERVLLADLHKPAPEADAHGGAPASLNDLAFGTPHTWPLATRASYTASSYSMERMTLYPALVDGTFYLPRIIGIEDSGSRDRYGYYNNQNTVRALPDRFGVCRVDGSGSTNFPWTTPLQDLYPSVTAVKRQNRWRYWYYSSGNSSALWQNAGVAHGSARISAEPNSRPLPLLACVTERAINSTTHAYGGARISVYRRDTGEPVVTLPRYDEVNLERDEKGTLKLTEAGIEVKSDKRPALSSLHFGGTPLIINGHLYVGACGVESSSATTYLACFQLEPASARDKVGALKWIRVVGGFLGDFDQDMDRYVESSQLVASGGNIFVANSIGSIVCMDARSGNIIWGLRYRGDEDTRSRVYYSNLTPASIKLEGTTLVASLPDASYAISVDASSGGLLSLPFNDGQISSAHLGSAGGRAYAINSDGEVSSTPVTFSERALNASGEWERAAPVTSDKLPDHLMQSIDLSWQPVFVANELLIFSEWGCLRFDRFTLKLLGNMPFPDRKGAPKPRDPKADTPKPQLNPDGTRAEPDRWPSVDVPTRTTVTFVRADQSPTGTQGFLMLNGMGAKFYPLVGASEASAASSSAAPSSASASSPESLPASAE